MSNSSSTSTSVHSSGPALRLPRSIYEEIIAHSRLGKPDEVCGILRGRDGIALELISARNIAEDRVNNYTVDPQILLLQFKFEEAGDEMIAVYHSHPISVAWPSATDAWNAGYPDTSYIICSLEFDDQPVLRAFRMITEWVEPDWAAVRAALAFYETRPNLFAWYQAADQPVPPVLQAVAGDLPKPFYVVYFLPDGDLDGLEGRIVTVSEHALEVI